MASAAPVLAGAVEDCEQSADQGRSIRGCTAIITGKQKGSVSVAYHNRGLIWLAKDDLDRAIADFNQAIRLNPKVANTYFLRGAAWSEKGDYDRAIADYSEMVKLSPSEQIGYVFRGSTYLLKGDLDRAGSAFAEVIKVFPEAVSGYWNRGRVHFHRADFIAASDDFMRAADLGDGHAMLWRFFTRARLKQDGTAMLF